jgi:hypothetical protein
MSDWLAVVPGTTPPVHVDALDQLPLCLAEIVATTASLPSDRGIAAADQNIRGTDYLP